MLLADLPITHQTPNTHSCHYTSSSQEKMQSAWFDSAVSPTIKMQEDDITFERYTIPKSESIFEEQESQQTREIKSHGAVLGSIMLAFGIVVWIYIMLFTYKSWGRPVYPPEPTGPFMDI